MFDNQKKKIREKLENYDRFQFQKKAASLEKYLVRECKLVDVGCGDGRFAKFLQSHFSCQVLGIDTINYLSTAIPFQAYDGGIIPLEDKSFDVAICLAVIHHTNDPELILKELHRIAKKVILIEDYCSNTLGKVGLHLNDYFTNVFQNLYKCWSGYRKKSVFQMQWQLKFKTEQELRAIFDRYEMRLIHFHRTKKSWKGMSHGVYVLC